MLIGLSGKQGVGKSTIAKEIELRYTNVKVFKFANIIYELQDYIYNRVGLTMQGEKDRPLLVALGMWGRSHNENIWVDVTLREALEYSRNGGIALIDDCRFPNEAKAIEDVGLLIRINGQQRGHYINEEMKSNTTETALDNYNFKNVINNEQSIEDMLKQIHNILGGNNVAICGNGRDQYVLSCATGKSPIKG